MYQYELSVEQAINGMAGVLTRYLEPEDINVLTEKWRKHSLVSIQLVQQSILDIVQMHPKLRSKKSEIRHEFMAVISPNVSETALQPPKFSEQTSISEPIQVFYAVIDFLRDDLPEPKKRSFIQIMHQYVASDASLKRHKVNVSQFLENTYPKVPDDSAILHIITQLAYLALCDEVGPVVADDMLYRCAEHVKQTYSSTVVMQLF